MLGNNRYPNVFKPLRIRNLTLKNRLQFAPTVILRCSPKGEVTQEMIDYISFQAQTGVSYITIGNTPVSAENGTAWLNNLNLTTEQSIQGTAALIKAARQFGAELSVELTHAGRNAAVSTGSKLYAPSKIPLPGRNADNIIVMNRSDMDLIKQQFVECAVRGCKAGLKIMMIHCGHKDLIGQFLAPECNSRNDEYGGTAEKRRRYPLEIIEAVREAVGDDIVLEMRVSSFEDNSVDAAFSEMFEFMKIAQKWIDIIHISRGSVLQYKGTPTNPAFRKNDPMFSAFSEEAREVLYKPFAVVGNITNLEQADEVISSGKADIVVMSKAYMADHELISKSLTGDLKAIRPCLQCETCSRFNEHGISMRCAINPGLSYDFGSMKRGRDDAGKYIIVAGGGPAGMTAAQTLVERGYRVKLFEKKEKLGGLLNDASRIRFKDCLRKYLEWSVYMTEKSGVEIVYGKAFDEKDIATEKPDAVVIATGSEYLIPDIPGINCSRVKTLRQILENPDSAGEKVIVCGGGISGLECALMLGQDGREVIVVDQHPTYLMGSGMPADYLADIKEPLHHYNVVLKADKKIERFSEYGIALIDSCGKRHLLKADTYIIAMGLVPQDELINRIGRTSQATIYPVGTCIACGINLYNTIHDAFNIARCI